MMSTTETSADIAIYGDITSWPWLESDVSSYNLSQKIAALSENIVNINIFINSYGGEVGEGLAIASLLKRHNAHVTTYCDGFAASIASVIFAAGDERIMSNASLIFIHNAEMPPMRGNAKELRKTADDLDTITEASIKAYMEIVNISEDELKALMDEEKWLTSENALKIGFATAITNYSTQKATASVTDKIKQILLKSNIKQKEDPQENKNEEKKEKQEELETEQKNNNEINMKKAKKKAFFNVINGGIK